jgi:hypothetical protein
MSLTLYTRDRESFLDGAIRNARIDLRYKLILLCLWVPGLMLAIMMKLSARHGGIGPAVANIPDWLVSIRGVTAISFIVLTAIWMLFRCRRSTAELGRLEALRRAYQEEAERDQAEES